MTIKYKSSIRMYNSHVNQGRIQGSGAPGAHPPKIGQNMIYLFFCVKSGFFTRNTPKMFVPRSDRHDYYKCTLPPPNLKSSIHPC